MKVIDAETLPDGSNRFVIEAIPEQPAVPEVRNATGDLVTAAVAAVPAATEAFTWGADVPLATARAETRLLLAARYSRPASKLIAGLVGKDV